MTANTEKCYATEIHNMQKLKFLKFKWARGSEAPIRAGVNGGGKNMWAPNSGSLSIRMIIYIPNFGNLSVGLPEFGPEIFFSQTDFSRIFFRVRWVLARGSCGATDPLLPRAQIRISIWICTIRYREIWDSRFDGFRGCSNFSGNSHVALRSRKRSDLSSLHL